MMKEIDLYTDGACSGNPGAGGYGAILIYRGVEREVSGGEPSTTNNRMEIYAVIAGLCCLKERCKVNIYSDSAYTVNAFIASEDRNFYSHRGLNYKRMIKALFTNIATRSFSQGASTISQQLIKNTHLTGDKTIKRKLTEIKLTKKLERM